MLRGEGIVSVEPWRQVLIVAKTQDNNTNRDILCRTMHKVTPSVRHKGHISRTRETPGGDGDGGGGVACNSVPGTSAVNYAEIAKH